MENTNGKYYKPKAEEFHVGFEFEFSTQNSPDSERDWSIRHIGDSCLKKYETPETFKRWIANGDVRVKYLDSSDIESLGFMRVGEEEYQMLIDDSEDFYTLDVNYGLREEIKIVYERCTGENMHTPRTIFYGTIKNKSELKKLLEQLHVI